MELNNKQKQVLLSGILGDGCLYKKGSMFFNSSHKEYMEFKKHLLGHLCINDVKERINLGYKRVPIYSIDCRVTKYGKLLNNYSVADILTELDELGIALWMYDDGSRHKKNNFYNINTHALDRETEEKIIIPYFNSIGVFPEILTEKKKDGRLFSYLYVPKWDGAMILSRMMRKLNIKCYDYKLMPVEMEQAYFDLKDTDEFKNATNRRQKTNLVKKHINCAYQENLHSFVTSIELKS